MSIWKDFLPEDTVNEQQEWFENELSKSTLMYICIGTKEVEAQWLQRWYGVPHDACIFISYSDNSNPEWDMRSSHIVLRPLPEGSDYKQHLKILKTEKLLSGL
jgi:hypothetical protein